MDDKPAVETTSPPQSNDNSGIAFTSASPLKGYSYVTAEESAANDSIPMKCDKGQPSFLSNKTTTPSAMIIQHFNSPPVTLLVGGPSSPSTELHPIPFYVHADLLTSVSSFFRAAFDTKSAHTASNKGWSFAESQTRMMRLPEERPEDVAYLMQWVYWGALHKRIVGRSQGSGVLVEGGLWHEEVDERVHRFGELVEGEETVEEDVGGGWGW